MYQRPAIRTSVGRMPVTWTDLLKTTFTMHWMTCSSHYCIEKLCWQLTAKFYPIDTLHVLCTLPPKCILFEQVSTTNAIFPGIGSTATPIFCSSGSVKIGNMSVTRHQVPVTPAWAITDYKVQGSTYEAVTLDLHRQSISSKRWVVPQEILLMLCPVNKGPIPPGPISAPTCYIERFQRQTG